MKNLKLKVNNIVCHSCEKTIVEELSQLEMVHKVSVNRSTGEVCVKGEEKISRTNIENKLTKLGYPLKEGKKNNWIVLIWIGLAIIILNVIFKNQQLVELIDLSKQQSYGVLFLVGVLTSFHCVFMCGGIAMSQSISNEGAQHNVKASLAYNAGRIISYTMIGGVVGAIGSLVMVSDQFRGAVTIGAGVFMVLFGLKFLGIIKFPSLSPKKSGVQIEAKQEQFNSNFVVGLLNGFMPCGPLQTIQLYALSTGSMTVGALSMFSFAVGTTPLMLGVGLFTSKINRSHSAKLLKISAIAVMFLGLVMFNRGLSLYGLSIPGLEVLTAQTTIEESAIKLSSDGYQEITLEVTGSNYIFDTSSIVVDIPVRLTIDVQGVSRCSNPIMIPKYNITKDLLIDDRVVEFTPNEIGKLRVTCWMGMITTNIDVVENVEI